MRNAEEQAGKRKEAEARIAERKEAEVNKQKEAPAKIAQQSSQLQFLYTYYIWMEICAERFTEFDNMKAGLREVLRSKEAGFPSEQADSIWNVTAEKFQQLEGVLQIAGDTQRYTDCDQNSRYIEGLLMLASRMGEPSQPFSERRIFRTEIRREAGFEAHSDPPSMWPASPDFIRSRMHGAHAPTTARAASLKQVRNGSEEAGENHS